MVLWLRLHAPNAGDPSSIPSQGARFQMLQLRPGTAREVASQLNKRYLFKNKKISPNNWPFSRDFNITLMA